MSKSTWNSKRLKWISSCRNLFWSTWQLSRLFLLCWECWLCCYGDSSSIASTHPQYEDQNANDDDGQVDDLMRSLGGCGISGSRD
eukprot:6456030-Amphidinium_carterae.1